MEASATLPDRLCADESPGIPIQQFEIEGPGRSPPKRDRLAVRAVRCLQTRVPALRWGPKYDFHANFMSDLSGGMTIGMVCVAQSLAHGAIATTHSIQGPYCSLVPTIVYALLGTSPHASVSSGAIVAMLISDKLHPWADIQDRTEVASLLALISGIVLLLIGLCKMGFAVRFLSHPTLSGFITGGAILIMTGQAKNLLGFRGFPHTSGFVSQIKTIIQFLPQTDFASVMLGITMMIVLTLFQRLKDHANSQIKKGGGGAARYRSLKRFTELKEIVVAVLGTGVAYLTAQLDPEGKPMLVTLGHLPAGLPSYQAPWDIPAFAALVKNHDRLYSLLTGGVLVAVTSFLTTFSTSKKVALRLGYEIDPSQEMIALSFAGIFGSFFRAFPPSGSLSRTGLAADIGVKTQLGGVFAAGMVGLGLTFLTPALRYLPKAALAAIILKAATSLLDFDTARKLMKSWKPARNGGLRRDMVIWCTAFAFTLLFGVVCGICFAVFLSILMIIMDASVPQAVELGCVAALGGRWCNIADWPDAQTFPGILVFEFRGPLFFANAEFFRESFERQHREFELRCSTPLSIVVLSLESVHRLDATALKMLEDLLHQWRRSGVGCIVSGAKHQVRALIEEQLVQLRKEAGLSALLDQTSLMLSVSEAVDLARKQLAMHQKLQCSSANGPEDHAPPVELRDTSDATVGQS